MTEKAKMLAGALYRGSDPELVRGQIRAQQLLERYHASDPDDGAAASSVARAA